MLFFWLFAIRLAANGRNVKNYVWKWWKNFWINTPQNSICTTSFHSFVTLARSFSLSVIISHCSCLLLWKSHDEDNRKQKIAQINATICEKKKKENITSHSNEVWLLWSKWSLSRIHTLHNNRQSDTAIVSYGICCCMYGCPCCFLILLSLSTCTKCI